MGSATDNAGRYYGPGDEQRLRDDIRKDAEEEIRQAEEEIQRLQDRISVLLERIDNTKRTAPAEARD